jgi:hypothetical protein
MLDCTLAESESEIQEEQSLGEYGGPQATICVETNLVLDQGKPWCIQPMLIVFNFESLLYVLPFNYALSLHELYGTVGASWLAF